MNAQHSSESNEHYTPPEIVEAARATMGGIDLDPASCEEANKVVKAAQWVGQDTCGLYGCENDQEYVDGLSCEWFTAHSKPTTVFLNPPGGQLNAETLEPAKHGVSSAAVWWWKLMHEWQAGNVEQAVFVCFSMGVFKTAQRKHSLNAGYPPPYFFPFCVPDQRLRFWNEATPIGTGSPSQDNAVVYLPPRGSIFDGRCGEAYEAGAARFAKAFASIGAVRV